MLCECILTAHARWNTDSAA